VRGRLTDIFHLFGTEDKISRWGGGNHGDVSLKLENMERSLISLIINKKCSSWLCNDMRASNDWTY